MPLEENRVIRKIKTMIKPEGSETSQSELLELGAKAENVTYQKPVSVNGQINDVQAALNDLYNNAGSGSGGLAQYFYSKKLPNIEDGPILISRPSIQKIGKKTLLFTGFGPLLPGTQLTYEQGYQAGDPNAEEHKTVQEEIPIVVKVEIGGATKEITSNHQEIEFQLDIPSDSSVTFNFSIFNYDKNKYIKYGFYSNNTLTQTMSVSHNFGTNSIWASTGNTGAIYAQIQNAYYQSRQISQPRNIIDMIYPVGSIYMSVAPTHPSLLFGGTWEALAEGKCLITTDSLDTNKYFWLGSQGGNANWKLPTHTHTLNINTDTKPNLKIKTTVKEDGKHKHNIHYYSDGWDKAPSAKTLDNVLASSAFKKGKSITKNSGTVSRYTSHAVSTSPVVTSAQDVILDSASSNHKHEITSTIEKASLTVTNPNLDDTKTISNSSLINTNYPPYIAVHMWKRMK